MKVHVKIKNLPKEFDFKSNINPYGLTYHAKEMDDRYIVSTDRIEWNYSKERLHNHLIKKEFVICK